MSFRYINVKTFAEKCAKSLPDRPNYYTDFFGIEGNRTYLGVALGMKSTEGI